MHTTSTKILLAIVFLIGCRYIAYGQNVSLNEALECSYKNFIENEIPKWSKRYREKRQLYFLCNYNPYGFTLDFLGKRWKQFTVIPRKNDRRSSRGLIGGKRYIGYPAIRIIGKDSLLIRVQMFTYNKNRTGAWSSDFASVFRIEDSVSHFKELEMSQRETIKSIRDAKNRGSYIDFYDLYPQAIKRSIDNLLRMGVPLQEIYIYAEYFPAWTFDCRSFSVKYINVGRSYKEIEKRGCYIIGWPILIIKEGYAAISIYCANRQWGEKRLIARVEYVFDDKAYRWKSVER